MSSQAIAHFESNQALFLEQLKDLVRIPSVSFDGFSKEEVARSAKKTEELLLEAGLTTVEILEVEGAHPYVYAEWLEAKDKPTLLLYAHHDVQPPMREEIWKSKPFDPTERDGRLFGRGAADDKAGIMVHVASIASYLKTEGKLPINIKFLIEGEEETGSAHLESFLKKYTEKLSADYLVISDCANYDCGIPSLTTSLRGMVSMEIETKSLDHPLHSGMWGGPLPDPIMALTKILSSLVDDAGEIAIPKILKMIKEPTLDEKKSFDSLGYTEKDLRTQAMMLPGTDVMPSSPPSSIVEQLWRRPSLVITQIQSGDRKSAGNVIMDSAWARVGVRTVPDMDNNRVYQLLEEKIKTETPWGVSVTITADAHGPHWITNTEDPVFEKAKEALRKGFEKEPVFIGCGGSIPFVKTMTEALGNIPALLTGVEDPQTNAHSENESLLIEDFYKAVKSQIYLFENLS